MKVVFGQLCDTSTIHPIIEMSKNKRVGWTLEFLDVGFRLEKWDGNIEIIPPNQIGKSNEEYLKIFYEICSKYGKERVNFT